MGQDRFDDMRVVFDAKLVRHRQQEGVGLGYRLVLRQFFDEELRLRGIAAAED